MGLVLAANPVTAQTPPTQQGGTLTERNEGIAATKHNLSVTAGRDTITGATTLTGLTDYGEICVYCHTPHGGSTDGPLWNRSGVTGADFTGNMYSDNPGKSDLNMVYAATPNPVSIACLTCHEGTVGIDVISNKPNPTNTLNPGINTSLGDYFTTGQAAYKVLGSDLRNDHPISMVYSPTQDDQFNTDIGILKLFGGGVEVGTVECATCHNPHTKNVTFLRIQNEKSALCLTCHIK